jgi:hypothetical protein
LSFFGLGVGRVSSETGVETEATLAFLRAEVLTVFRLGNGAQISGVHVARAGAVGLWCDRRSA